MIAASEATKRLSVENSENARAEANCREPSVLSPFSKPTLFSKSDARFFNLAFNFNDFKTENIFVESRDRFVKRHNVNFTDSHLFGKS